MPKILCSLSHRHNNNFLICKYDNYYFRGNYWEFLDYDFYSDSAQDIQ